jgi:hypothetical protein
LVIPWVTERRTPLRRPGRVIDITSWIEHRHVAGGVISEYRSAA